MSASDDADLTMPMWITYNRKLVTLLASSGIGLDAKLAQMQETLDDFSLKHGREQSSTFKFIDWVPSYWGFQAADIPGPFRRLFWKYKYPEYQVRDTCPLVSCSLLALARHPKAAQLLLDNQADVNYVHLGTGRTCLMDFICCSRPISRGNCEPDNLFKTLMVLLKAKVELNKVDADGLTALSLCWLSDVATELPSALKYCGPIACFVFTSWYQQECSGSRAQLAGLLVLAGADVAIANAGLVKNGRRPITQYYIDRGVALAQKMLDTCAQQGEMVLTTHGAKRVQSEATEEPSLQLQVSELAGQVEALSKQLETMTMEKQHFQEELSTLHNEVGKHRTTRGKRSGQQVRAKFVAREAHQPNEEGDDLQHDFCMLPSCEKYASENEHSWPDTHSQWS